MFRRVEVAWALFLTAYIPQVSLDSNWDCHVIRSADASYSCITGTLLGLRACGVSGTLIDSAVGGMWAQSLLSCAGFGT